MTGALLLLNAAVITSLFSGRPGAEVQSQPGEMQGPARTTFRSAIDVVSVSAVVRDRKGRFVGNLAQHDFVIAEGGETRKILDFRAQSDGPVKVALLFDISGSMRLGTKVADARQAARHVFRALKTGDEAAVFSFDTRLQRVAGFSADLAALDEAVDRVELPYGQTSLYDAIAETASAVALEGGEDGRAQQRSAIVVLTDGIDTRSRLTAEQVSSIASGIDIPVYIVAVMSPVDDPRRDGVAHSGGPLQNLARLTGGDFFTSSAPAHASVAARQIIEELRHQYLLAFEASTRAGWRPLEVRARDTDLTVRARAGYRVDRAIGSVESGESVAGDIEQTNADRLTVPLARRTR
jgi:Ca-activated chloride channel homolog